MMAKRTAIGSGVGVGVSVGVGVGAGVGVVVGVRVEDGDGMGVSGGGVVAAVGVMPACDTGSGAVPQPATASVMTSMSTTKRTIRCIFTSYVQVDLIADTGNPEYRTFIVKVYLVAQHSVLFHLCQK
jgi:hypothetical protein